MSGPIHISHLARVHLVALSICICGGGIGGLLNILLQPLWHLIRLSGHHGVLTHIHVPFTTPMIYHMVTWGAIWGLTLCLPLHKWVKNFWARACLFGIPPSIVGIIMYAPHHTHGVGVLTFIIFVLITNIIGWSIPAYLWVAACGASEGRVGINEEGASAPLLG